MISQVVIPAGYQAVTVEPTEESQPISEVLTMSSTITPVAVAATQKAPNKFLSFLKHVGQDFEKGLGIAVKVAPEVNALANIIFPASIAVTAPATAALNLIQNSVISIEQKYAASGIQSGTGLQKSAEVLSLAGPAATQLLTQAGVSNVTDDYISSIVTAVVGVLNAISPTSTTTTVTG